MVLLISVVFSNCCNYKLYWPVNVPAKHYKREAFHAVQDCYSVNFFLIWQAMSGELQLYILSRLKQNESNCHKGSKTIPVRKKKGCVRPSIIGDFEVTWPLTMNLFPAKSLWVRNWRYFTVTRECWPTAAVIILDLQRTDIFVALTRATGDCYKHNPRLPL